MSRRNVGLLILLVASVVLGVAVGAVFFGLFVKTVPPAVITSFNKVTAQGAFLLYGALTGVVIFLWSLAALALSRMFRTGGKAAAGGPAK
jgi:hypothetical protein